MWPGDVPCSHCPQQQKEGGVEEAPSASFLEHSIPPLELHHKHGMQKLTNPMSAQLQYLKK